MEVIGFQVRMTCQPYQQPTDTETFRLISRRKWCKQVRGRNIGGDHFQRGSAMACLMWQMNDPPVGIEGDAQAGHAEGAGRIAEYEGCSFLCVEGQDMGGICLPETDERLTVVWLVTFQKAAFSRTEKDRLSDPVAGRELVIQQQPAL